MKPDGSHIKQIKVVSNTHWDREFRRSFEKTRHRLLTMMDVTLDILENDPNYHSFTMDGHCIMIDDYLEMRPERRPQVEKFIREGRVIIGPWYTLPETMSISHEAFARNFLWGRRKMQEFGAPLGTVAYTPASWGQTGQLPQILNQFGLTRMMFYRGISHHECDAEFLWEAPDGSTVTSSRFGLFARYNWYYQVHRSVTRNGRVFGKDYIWGEFDEAPFRFSDGLAGEDLAFDLKSPSLDYDKSNLKKAVVEMVDREGPHFTTEVFLAMHGHDISAGHPLEAKIVADAQEELKGTYTVEHTDLESYWKEMDKHLNPEEMTVLKGERRQHLRKGMWTYLLPASISARVYLKLQDFESSAALAYLAEPMAALATSNGADYPVGYLDRGWMYLLSNHTHDANGGCAPDVVCKDMEYRYRKVSDIADIVEEDSMAYISRNLSPAGQDEKVMQLIVFNTLPMERDVIAMVDIEIPREYSSKSVVLESDADTINEIQPISWEKSSSFVDSIWDVPTILESDRMKFYAKFSKLPGVGYRAYRIKPDSKEMRSPKTLVIGHNSMENDFVKVIVEGNGALTVLNKTTGMVYENLNYLSDQGEAGNAWRHTAPDFDRDYNSIGVTASVAVKESGPLVSVITAQFNFPVPEDYADGTCRSDRLVDLPVLIEYRLEANSARIGVKLTVDNVAKDHWLRANFPSDLETDVAWADSHFDVVSREIAVPDSTGWVEKFEPTHPLRTFVDVNDGDDGLAVFTKGLFEYEARDDERKTVSISLIRSCRIKLQVSEEKMTELPDAGVQCPGVHTFEYAIYPHEGTWETAGLSNRAAESFVPVRLATIGRGKGDLPLESSLFVVNNDVVHVTAVKQAEDGNGLMIRLYNPSENPQDVEFLFGKALKEAATCLMDESIVEKLVPSGNKLAVKIKAKKIANFRVKLA
jgi:2-O-(6-phospho-alpha-D-mannosyl)-D-glycerate hydrolase